MIRSIRLCVVIQGKTRGRCDLSSRLRLVTVVPEHMVPLEDGRLIVRCCRDRETRPTAPVHLVCALPRFPDAVLRMTIPVELFSRGRETRPTAPDEIHHAHS